MLIDIRTISQCTGASVAIEREISPEELPFSAQDYHLTRALVFRGQLQNDGDGILSLTGQIQTAYAGECARCLAPVVRDLDVALTEAFFPAKDADKAAGKDSYVYEGSQLDISQAIRDNLVLSLPPRLYCREDCRGLCPVCGADLNQTDCGCAAAREGKASPFDQLRKLL